MGYSAGDAVKANMAAQTVDPAKDFAYSVKGLGKNGYVEPKPPTGGMAKRPPPTELGFSFWPQTATAPLSCRAGEPGLP